MRLLLRGLIATLMLAAVSVQASDQRHQAWTVLLQRHVVWLPGGHESRTSYAGFQRDHVALKSRIGHFLLIKALELERASVLSPFGYAQLISVTLFGYLAFGQWPDSHTFIGMAVIVGSGLYVAWGHRARRNEELDSAIEWYSKA